MKKRRSLYMTAVLLTVTALILSGCGGQTADTPSASFSWWLPQGEDALYYTCYNDNPVVQYLQTLPFGEDGQTVEFDFIVPPTGTAVNHITTAISTREYQDIIDVASITNSMSVLELYEEGIALDITEYVEQYMPNYLAFLNANPDLKTTAVNLVDGEQKYLQLWAYQDAVEMWGGLQYRRDWILKYGKHPETGAAFTGGYSADNVWHDDIVFPSWYDSNMNTYKSAHPDWDGTDPVTISDWEWMLQCFQDAMTAENITGGYVMQLYYPGYMETGDI